MGNVTNGGRIQVRNLKVETARHRTLERHCDSQNLAIVYNFSAVPTISPNEM